MPPQIPYNVNVPLCTAMTELVVIGGPTEVQAFAVTAVVNAQWPDEAGRVSAATLVSTKHPVITFPHTTGPVVGHLTMVYDYDAQHNVVTIHSDRTHISTVFGQDTSRVWSNGSVSGDQGNANWSLNFVPEIAAMLAGQVVQCQAAVVAGMRGSPAAYIVNLV